MELERLLLVFVIIASLSVGQTQKTTTRGCPEGWTMFTNARQLSTCFWLSRDKDTWINAATWCGKMGGYLAEIAKSHYNGKLARTINIQKPGNYWIGLSDQENEGRYVWMEKKTEPIKTFFAPFSPDAMKNCVYMNEKGRWREESCNAQLWYICQKK